MKRSRLELRFQSAWEIWRRSRQPQLPAPEIEYRFHPERKWRFDFAWPSELVAVEVQGGAWVNGRHNRAGGMASDREKAEAAQELGWVVVYVLSGDFKNLCGRFERIERLIRERKRIEVANG